MNPSEFCNERKTNGRELVISNKPGESSGRISITVQSELSKASHSHIAFWQEHLLHVSDARTDRFDLVRFGFVSQFLRASVQH